MVEKLKKSYRFVDLIFGTHNIYKFAEYLAEVLARDEMVVEIWKDTDQIVENLPVDRKYPFKSGVNIMFGCNNFCSYCIVPYVRGRREAGARRRFSRRSGVWHRTASWKSCFWDRTSIPTGKIWNSL